MLVAQPREDNVVAFGGQAQDFAIGDPAVITEMLSTTLYPDKPKAVVREILCNAFDAHVDAGLEHVPVDIIIDKNTVEFRDYGKGVPQHSIIKIYCTYASSTKRNKSNLTGGHGVGSKSPFCLTDHFTVISRADGLLSTNSIIKTSGVPQCIFNGGRPCEDQGISVIIPLKNTSLVDTLQYHAKRIAADAGMPIRINGELFDVTSNIVVENDLYRMTKRLDHRTPVDILYGRVIYPFQAAVHPELDELHSELSRLVGQLTGISAYTISIKAPADSLATALSRESLSFTDQSIDELITAFQAVIDHVKAAKSEAEKAFLLANRVARWTELIDLRNGALHLKTPDHENAMVRLFMELTRSSWYNRLGEEKSQHSNFVKATKSTRIAGIARKLDRSPIQFHLDRLTRALGPLARDLRVVRPASGSFDNVKHNGLAQRVRDDEKSASRVLSKDQCRWFASITRRVTLTTSLMGIEREGLKSGIFLIVKKKQRDEALLLLQGIEKLGYEVRAVQELQPERTPRDHSYDRVPRQKRVAKSAEWSFLDTGPSDRYRHTSYGKRDYKLTALTTEIAAYSPLNGGSKEVQLTDAISRIDLNKCLDLIAGGPVAMIRKISEFKDATRLRVPPIHVSLEASLLDMQARLGADGFYLAVRIAAMAKERAYKRLYYDLDIVDRTASLFALFPNPAIKLIFGDDIAAPTPTDILKIIAVLHMVDFHRAGQTSAVATMKSSHEKFQEQIKACDEDASAGFKRIEAVIRSSLPADATLVDKARARIGSRPRLEERHEILVRLVHVEQAQNWVLNHALRPVDTEMTTRESTPELEKIAAFEAVITTVFNMEGLSNDG